MKYQFDINELLLAISEVIDITDSALMLHQQRTTYIAIKMARLTNLNDYEIETLFLAAILHDIGALTTVEKVRLHEFQKVDIHKHCELGYKLFNDLDWLKPSSKIVLQHHNYWETYDTPINHPSTLLSQILYLADLVERKIKKGHYILLQKHDVIKEVQALGSNVVHPYVIDLFIQVSKSDKFWFELDTNQVQDVLSSMLTKKYVNLDIASMKDFSIFLRKLIDFRSPSTANHSAGVAICASSLAKLFSFSEEESQLMEIAGNLHDIGKLGVPERLLEKPGKLTPDEFEVIKMHVFYTYKILQKVHGFEQFSQWAAHHHEKLNGTGYPFSLHDKDISLGAKIFAVSDVYTAITEDRSYHNFVSLQS